MKMTLDLQDPYLAYYKLQLGRGIGVVYKGAAHQRGHGIGSFLGGLFRTITPLLKSGAKAMGSEALKTGVNLLGDIVSSVPPNQAMTSRVKEFTANLKRKADNKIERVMNGSGYKRKKHHVTPQSLQRLLAVKQQRKGSSGRRKPKAKKKTTPSSSKLVVKDIFH